MLGKGKLFADVPFQVGDENIILVQPKLTLEMDRKEFLRSFNRDEVRQEKDYFNQVFRSVVEFRDLVHLGFLPCGCYCNRPGTPQNFLPCGGNLSTKRIFPGDENSWLGKEYEFAITCSNPACGMTLGTCFDWSEIATKMLHLMIKQMIPMHKSCNFIDLYNWVPDGWLDHDLIESGKAEEIKRLGVVSFIGALFYGVIKNEYFRKVSGSYSLGFILMPGMDTFRGCDGFDEWLKFLVLKMIKANHVATENLTERILGPRQMPKSHLRDW